MSAPAEPTPDRARHRPIFRLSYLFIPVALIVLAALILELIPANVYVLLPGDALPVSPMINIPGHPVRAKRGQLLLTDVSLFKADHLLEELWGRLQPNSDTEPATTVAGGLSDQQFNQLNFELMNDSIHQAEYAALSLVPGFHPHFAKTGPKIVFLIPRTPASKRLRSGDVVLAVNGHRTLRATEVAPLVHAVRPGQSISLTVLRHGRRLTVSVTTVPSTNGQPDKHGKTPLIGIELQDQVIFPVKIQVNPGDIGGPSAGLMFTLGIIQRLTAADITRGCRIAGTGTIDFQGNVGEIGGAAQKIVAASNAGAKYFFVPDFKDNLRPALAHRGGVTVVPVKTLHQALDYLRGIKPCR